MRYAKSTGGFYVDEIHGMDYPPDAVEITAVQHAELLAAQSAGRRIACDDDGYPVAVDPPPQTEAQIIAARVAAVQAHMDATARDRGYDDIATAVTYADEPAVAKFQTEGIAYRAWRSQVWAHCYQVLDDCRAGLRPIPEPAALLAELPALTLP